MKTKNKTLLIGWDAADWRQLKPLMEKGVMPTLKHLVDCGTHGPLSSLEPMISPVLWTSMATGRRAYDHGIHGFVEAKPNGDGIRPIRASKRKEPAVWNVLNRFGFKTHVINWWPSHPAESVDGIMVSNFYGIPEQKNNSDWPLMPGAVHPVEKRDDYADLQVHPSELTAEILGPFFPNYPQLDVKDPIIQSVAKILAHTCSTHNAITQAMEADDWDFSAVYYNGLDHFLHVANRYAPPQMPDVSDEDFEKYHYVVEAALRFHDMMLARLLKLAGEACNIILVSDHGFDVGEQRKVALPEQMGAPSLEHQPYGVFLGYGPDFKVGFELKGASLLDVCPTILQLFYCPVSRALDGVVLWDALQQKGPTQTVPDFSGIPAFHSFFEEENQLLDEELLLQLQALGYVSDTPTDLHIAAVLRENQYYLARSLVDGGKYQQAVVVLQGLIQEDPNALRFQFLLLHAAFQCNDTVAIAAQIQQLADNHRGDDVRTLYYKGLWYLNQQQPRLAVACFDAVINYAKSRPGLLLQIAHAYVQAGAFSEATAVLDRVPVAKLTQPDVWHFLKAQCLFESREPEQALDHVLSAIAERFAFPERHALLAAILWELKEQEDAVQALHVASKLAPTNQQYLEQLRSWNGKIKSDVVERYLIDKEREKNEHIVVVSGLPRSGTSLMMQVLAAQGFPIFRDATRQPDTHNPRGYFEHQSVKQLAVNPDFLMDAKGKAIKIVAPLVQRLPPHFHYKVIFMHRPTTEVILSQEKMKGASEAQLFQFFPLERALKLEQTAAASLQQLEKAPHVEVIQIAYRDMMTQPEKVCKQLTDFMGIEFDGNTINRVIDTSLYRSKL